MCVSVCLYVCLCVCVLCVGNEFYSSPANFFTHEMTSDWPPGMYDSPYLHTCTGTGTLATKFQIKKLKNIPKQRSGLNNYKNERKQPCLELKRRQHIHSHHTHPSHMVYPLAHHQHTVTQYHRNASYHSGYKECNDH